MASILKNIFPLSLLFILLLSCSDEEYQDEVSTDAYLEFYRAGVEAYNQQDYTGFRDNFIKANETAPNHLTISYYLAAGYALTGMQDEAFGILNRLAGIGVDFGMQNFTAFDSLKADPRFETILKKLETAIEPVSNSSDAFRLPEKDLLTEGLAHDPVSDSFYISSVHRSKIIKVYNQDILTDFIDEGEYGIWSILGIQTDTDRRHLWVTSDLMPQTRLKRENEHSGTGIFKFDLESGGLIKKYVLVDTTSSHSFNDLALSENGDVYISDTGTSEIYRIDSDKDELELFIGAGKIYGPQGITVSPDDKYLFIEAYTDGIYRIELKNKRIRRIRHDNNVTLSGIDGLCFYNDSFIAIHNGIRPNRVMRYYLDKNWSEVLRSEILEMGNPEFIDPTLGTIVGDVFYYIANSQWPFFRDDGTHAPVEQLKEPLILKIELK